VVAGVEVEPAVGEFGHGRLVRVDLGAVVAVGETAAPGPVGLFGYHIFSAKLDGCIKTLVVPNAA
jgi:hypothetical protein